MDFIHPEIEGQDVVLQMRMISYIHSVRIANSISSRQSISHEALLKHHLKSVIDIQEIKCRNLAEHVNSYCRARVGNPMFRIITWLGSVWQLAFILGGRLTKQGITYCISVVIPYRGGTRLGSMVCYEFYSDRVMVIHVCACAGVG